MIKYDLSFLFHNIILRLTLWFQKNTLSSMTLIFMVLIRSNAPDTQLYIVVLNVDF
mgnify:CR=1 FL=1